MTEANRQLREALKTAKGKGRPIIARAPVDKRTWCGIVYDSVAEMTYAKQLQMQRIPYTRQVKLELGGGRTYVADFAVGAGGSTVVEIKGGKMTKGGKVVPIATPSAKLKFVLARDRYPDLIFEMLAYYNGSFHVVRI